MPESHAPADVSFRSLLPQGTRVGSYVISGSLGKGGMGAVYSAFDPELDRRVALKLLSPAASTDTNRDELQARMVLEARAMARLSHPNVVTLFQVGPAPDGGIYLAMELVEGGTLGEWLDQRPRRWEETLAILCEAGEGLAAAHRAGLIHRDFKLENVLVRKDGRPQVTDFGLVRSATRPSEARRGSSRPPAANGGVLPASMAPETGGEPTRTLTDEMKGTPGYMAPEQYTMDVELDARVDVFAFCATLYRALYGVGPFDDDPDDATDSFATTAPVRDRFAAVAEATVLGRVRPPPPESAVPTWVRKAVLSGLAAEREMRPATMDALLAALRANPAIARRRRLAGAAGALLAIGALVGWNRLGEARVRECRDAADRVDVVWSAPRKEAIAGAFRASGVGYAEDTWSRVEHLLDTYASSWRAAAYDACAANRIRGEQSPSMREQRTECLDERLDELRALGDVLATADRVGIQNAVKVARSLPGVQACSDVDRIAAAVRLPQDAKARAEIRAVQGRLAEARELLLMKSGAAKERLDAVEDRAKATAYAPVLVSWATLHARLDEQTDTKKAADEWRNAVALADASHLDRERAEAEIALGSVMDDSTRYADAHAWFALASATLERVGGDAQLELSRSVLDGLASYHQGNYGAAVDELGRALDRGARDSIEDPRSICNAHSFLAFALSKGGEHLGEAVEHARAAVSLMERAYGPEHPNVLIMASNLASIEEFAGRYDAALASSAKAVGSYERAIARGELSPSSPNYGIALATEGTVAARSGRLDDGIALLRRARAIGEAVGRADILFDVNIHLADALRARGQIDEAARVCAEARAFVDANKSEEPRPDTLVTLLTVEAAIALARRNDEDALDRAEHAVRLAETGVSVLLELSDARLVLARALARNKDAPRAKAVAEEARRGFAQLDDVRRATDAAELVASR